jgi:hypothetical protein
MTGQGGEGGRWGGKERGEGLGRRREGALGVQSLEERGEI